MSEKEREEKLLQVIQSVNGLKAWIGSKKADDIVTTQENAIKKTFDKRFAILLDFDIFRHPVYPYGLKQNLIVRLELNSSEKVFYALEILQQATYKLSDILLEYDTIFDEAYVTSLGEIYTGTTSILYTKVTSIHYQTLSKKDTTWKIDVNNLSVRSMQGLLLLFLDKRDDFANKNEEFYNPSIKKILVTINGMPHQLFAAGQQGREIYPELKKYFYKENFDVTRENFLTTKFALWIDTRSRIDNTLHGSGRATEKSGILLQIQKPPESKKKPPAMFSLEYAVAHLRITDPSGILTIEK